MGFTNYLIRIIVSICLFIALCFIGTKLKEFISHRDFDLTEFFPIEEILTFKQLYYLFLILIIYFCIMCFFLKMTGDLNGDLILIAFLIDIIFSIYITVSFYDGSLKRRIICIFLMPIPSMSHILFGASPIGYWDFVRIPALLYLVVYYYNEFLAHTERNNLDKLILILLTVIYLSMIFTLIAENRNPLNSLAMVSNAFTSNGYAVLGETTWGILISTVLVWAGYIISGVGTASLASAIVSRNSRKDVEKLSDKQDNLERMIGEVKKSEASQIAELKSQLESIHDENAELKREIVELKELIKNK